MEYAAVLETTEHPQFSQATSGDFIRDLDSFEDFGDVADAHPSDLDRLFQAITVDAISATECHWNNGWSGPRATDHSMWFYIAKGQGWGWSGSTANTFQYKPGSLILLSPETWYFIEPAPGGESHVFCVTFHARVFGTINLLSLLGVAPVCDGGRDSILHSISARLAREFALKKPGWRIVMAAAIRTVLFQVIRNTSRSLRPDIKLSSLAEMPRLIPVFCYIEENLQKIELSVAEMAQRAHLSEVRFRNIFHKITGDTPLRYLQRRRIERACRMLSISTESVANISEDCGFSDAPFFHRVFKHWTGFTPREYRCTPRI